MIFCVESMFIINDDSYFSNAVGDKMTTSSRKNNPHFLNRRQPIVLENRNHDD